MLRNRTVALARWRWEIRGIPYFLVLDAAAPPDVRRVCCLLASCREKLLESVGAFREDLVRVPVRVEHDVCDGLDVLVGHGVLEEVAHTVDEYGFRGAPPEGFNELLWYGESPQPHVPWQVLRGLETSPSTPTTALHRPGIRTG